MSKNKIAKGWYVAEDDLLTSSNPGFRDRLPIREGETLTLPDDVIPKVCMRGYHCCERLLDALGRRDEGRITLVEVAGNIDVGTDKIAGRSRRTLRIVPKVISERECRLFAADVAEQRLLAEHTAGREFSETYWTAVNVARRFAEGKASVKELREVRVAAKNINPQAQVTPEWMMRLGVVAPTGPMAARRVAKWAAMERSGRTFIRNEPLWTNLSLELENRIIRALKNIDAQPTGDVIHVEHPTTTPDAKNFERYMAKAIFDSYAFAAFPPTPTK